MAAENRQIGTGEEPSPARMRSRQHNQAISWGSEETTMKHARLLSTVAAGLLLSTAAFAQAPSKDSNPAGAQPAPAAQQNAPAEKTAPNMKAGQPNAETHKAPATTGQSPAAQNGAKPGNPDKAVDKGSMEKSTQNAPIKPSDANG